MTVIAECAFPPNPPPLGEDVRVPAGTRVELERIVPTGQGMLPYVLVESDDPDGFVSSLREQSAVESVEVLDGEESVALLRVRWTAVGSVVHWLGDADAALLGLEGNADGWLLRLRAEKAVVEAFDTHCREQGVQFDLRRLYEGGDDEQLLGRRVTEIQRETLRLAYETGYYEEPRETTLGELAAELDVGERAVSRRLRRGVGNLLAAEFGNRPRNGEGVT
jgi:predicted DNA binding protein